MNAAKNLTRDDDPQLWDRPWEGDYKAAVHVRYHLSKAHRWGIFDRGARLSVLFLSIVAFAGPFTLTIGMPEESIKAVWLPVGLFALLLSLTLNVVPFGDWHNTHAVLSQRWQSLQKSWEQLRRDRGTMSRDGLNAKVKELEQAELAIETAEPPSPSSGLLKKCQAAQKRFMGPSNNVQTTVTA